MIPDVGNLLYANSINSSLNGVADRNDIEKRQIAENILKHGNTFEAITILLPNGDMYISNEGKFGSPTLLYFPYKMPGNKSSK